MLDFFIKSILSCGGIGHLPMMPGTYASAFMAGIYLLIGYNFEWAVSLSIVSAIIIAGVVMCVLLGKPAERIYGQKDPPQVVLDEVVGYSVAVLGVPGDFLVVAVIGFVLFRLFDIWKPLWIGKIAALPGGWGIVSDDVLAGVVANVIMQVGYVISARLGFF